MRLISGLCQPSSIGPMSPALLRPAILPTSLDSSVVMQSRVLAGVHATVRIDMRAIAIITAVSAVAAAIVVPANANAADSSDTVVARGQLVRDGRQVVGQVRVRVWPDETWLQTLPEGTQFDLLELRPVATDRRGRFAVTLPFDLPSRFVGPKGDVDVEVVASDGVTATTHNFTAAQVAAVSAVASGGSRRWAPLVEAEQARAGVDVAVAPPVLSLELGAATAKSKRSRAAHVAAAAGLGDGDVEATPGVGPAAAFDMGSGSDTTESHFTAMSGGGCSTSSGSRHGPYLEHYASFYGTAYAKGKVIHEYRTTNTVGVGVKYSGSSTWSANGTQGTSGSFSYNSGYRVVNAAVKNKVWERYYYYSCIASDGKIYTTTYTRPNGIYDGPHYAQVAYVSYSTCSRTYSGHEYSRKSGTNTTISGGLDLPFINLSAQSGWTETTEMWWYFSRSGKLCGSNSQTWTSAPRVSAYA